MRSKARKPASSKTAEAAHFENIEALIDGIGDITVGSIGPIRCAATAADNDQCLAMLVRRPRESLLDLLRRLDAAIASAYNERLRRRDQRGADATSETNPQVKTVTAGRLQIPWVCESMIFMTAAFA